MAPPRFLLCLLVLLSVGCVQNVLSGGGVRTLPVTMITPTSTHRLATHNQSSYYELRLNASQQQPFPYTFSPYVLKLKGTRHQIGYDFAALVAKETSHTYHSFLNALTGSNAASIEKFGKFADYIWDSFYTKYVPDRFLAELRGMEQWWIDHGASTNITFPPHVVSRRFYTLANMPADPQNIIAAFEQEFEHGWPKWLKDIINDIIAILEKYIHSCDAYGVWGSRTQKGRLYSSRNLDYNSDTGINRYKLAVMYEITEDDGTKAAPYTSIGFTFGLGALAGQSLRGVTTSEMNLDNSRTTFSGIPFPLRLRYVLENAHDLNSAMTLWNATNNTNSFNFLIASAKDGQAYALETMRHYTGVFPADSSVERAATYDCGVPPNEDPTCHKWTNETGVVRIGFPLKEAVWRTNHGMNPVIMATQEPLFNDTIFRYNLMHDLFSQFQEQKVLIDDTHAVEIVATLGTKGDDFFTCEQDLSQGSNVLSVAYVPGEGRFFAAWESGTGAAWRPAACSPYVAFDLHQWF